MNKFHKLTISSKIGERPTKINFPFNYEPHPWAIQAAEELKKYLVEAEEMNHDFKINQQYEDSVSGKMFGVLVCEDSSGEIGYLAAFSGKLGDKNVYDFFVPPVFDILNPTGFFLQEVEEINEINRTIRAIEKNVDFQEGKQEIDQQIIFKEEKITQRRAELKKNKQLRDNLRLTLSDAAELEKLNKESAIENITFKRYKRTVLAEIEGLRAEKIAYLSDLKRLKSKRSALSNQLQKKIFQEFRFLNAHGQEKDLNELFTKQLNVLPPAGAGECAAPKLFQYAFKKGLKPIALAEFWYGQSPKSEVRKHGQFYPSCKGKCEPILTHMLEGLNVEENPMLVRLRQLSQEVKELEVLYEDDYVVVIHKPEGFLSVSGNLYEDSVLTRLMAKYPEATGPLLLHRLDMSTSGLLLAAKDKKVHQLIQQQFTNRTIIKRYDAVLDGELQLNEGEISLPLRVDLNDRPRQVVCYEHGKEAITRFEKIKTKNKQTLVHFWPITGRTHQLRIHASHVLGLNMPIVGDDLYGRKADRLYLHAGYLDFYHPILKKRVVVEKRSGF